jgi:MraZ protein
MFIGEYQHTVDEKGRLAIPAKFRKALSKGAVITRGLDSCLFVFTVGEWKVLAAKLASLPMSQANSRAFARLMLAGAMDVKLDSQGRVMLPEYLRKYAKVGRDTVIAGLYSRLEIWDSKVWEKYKTKTESNSSGIAEKMGELGV